jgi:F0F1-type ATP synthase membrane subunit b/b'
VEGATGVLASRQRKISKMRNEASALREAAQECETDLAQGVERMGGYAETFRFLADELEAKIAELEGAGGVTPATPSLQSDVA